jgi:hypothetical protein
MTYALIVMSITHYGATLPQRIPGFDSMKSCTEFGEAYVDDPKRHTASRLQRRCEIGRIDEPRPPGWVGK